MLNSFFAIDPETGSVYVSSRLDRNVAAVITLPVQVIDSSAIPPQNGYGSLVITLVDVNDYEPTFEEPWSPENPYLFVTVPEELANGTVVHKFTASDQDSNIESFAITSKSDFFEVCFSVYATPATRGSWIMCLVR